MSVCRHCQSPEVLDSTKFCPECGKPFPVALDDPATWQRAEKTGTCRICQYEPVASEAAACPCCGAKNPIPGSASWPLELGSAIGLLLGTLGGVMFVNMNIVGGPGELFWIFFGTISGSLCGYMTAGMLRDWLGRSKEG